MSRWLILPLGLLLSCAHSGAPQGISLLSDSCGDAEPGFDRRMSALASSVWQTSDGKGAVQHMALEDGQGECPIGRGFYVQLEPYLGGYRGQVVAAAYDKCTEMSCSIAYAVEGK